MRIVAIVQARMGSTRLPGKVLRPLLGEPMLAQVVARLQRAQELAEVWVATSTLPGDDPIAALCAERSWPCFRGAEDDVLARYAGAAQAAQAEAIVRITADCPLIDPGVVDGVCAEFRQLQPGWDYVCNFFPRRTFPRGLDAEIFLAETLTRCHQEATDASSREHVTAFIYRHPEKFRLHGVENPEGDYAHLRWTVDTPEDFALATAVYQHFGHAAFSWIEALAAVHAHPEWMELNRHVEQKQH